MYFIFYENSMHTERDIYNKRALHDETYSLINDKSKLLKHYLHQHEQSLEAIKRFFFECQEQVLLFITRRCNRFNALLYDSGYERRKIYKKKIKTFHVISIMTM